jgi:glycosyltransferase involved in cell wall biosynthesis
VAATSPSGAPATATDAGAAPPLRVAFVMPGVGVIARGAEAFVVELGTALAADPGFAVEVFSRGPAPLPHRRVRALSRDARPLVALHRSHRLVRKGLDTLYLDPLNVEWGTAALSSLPRLWRRPPDVLVMEGGLVGGWVGRLLRRLRRIPFVDVAHGNSPRWEGAFARQRPDRVVAFTPAAAAMIAERAPRARIVTIPHGVDLARFRPDVPAATCNLPRPVLLAAGAVDGHKRLHLTVEALARLGRGSLIVLGDGEGAAELDALAGARLGAGRYLRRQVPRAEMPAWYAVADLFTLPSLTESFGLVYLEAMACGVPCVATDDEVRRQVLGDGGLVCDVDDAAAYADTLAAALATEWGSRPRQQAERFPFAATVGAWKRLLREVATEIAAERAR